MESIPIFYLPFSGKKGFFNTICTLSCPVIYFCVTSPFILSRLHVIFNPRRHDFSRGTAISAFRLPLSSCIFSAFRVIGACKCLFLCIFLSYTFSFTSVSVNGSAPRENTDKKMKKRDRRANTVRGGLPGAVCIRSIGWQQDCLIAYTVFINQNFLTPVICAVYLNGTYGAGIRTICFGNRGPQV